MSRHKHQPYNSESMNKAYHDGRQAFGVGFSLVANPHNTPSEYLAWAEGWRTGQSLTETINDGGAPV